MSLYCSEVLGSGVVLAIVDNWKILLDRLLVTLVEMGAHFRRKVDIFVGIVILTDFTLLTDKLKFSVSIEITPPIHVKPINIQKNTDMRYKL